MSPRSGLHVRCGRTREGPGATGHLTAWSAQSGGRADVEPGRCLHQESADMETVATHGAQVTRGQLGHAGHLAPGHHHLVTQHCLYVHIRGWGWGGHVGGQTDNLAEHIQWRFVSSTILIEAKHYDQKDTPTDHVELHDWCLRCNWLSFEMKAIILSVLICNPHHLICMFWLWYRDSWYHNLIIEWW